MPSLGAKCRKGQQLNTCPAGIFSKDTEKHAEFQRESTDYTTWLVMNCPADRLQPIVRDRPLLV